VVNFLLHQQNLIFYVEFYIGYVQNLNKDGVLSPMLGGSLFYEECSTLVLKNKLNYLHFNSMHKGNQQCCYGYNFKIINSISFFKKSNLVSMISMLVM
jgi:hypothetical protein